MRANPFLLMGLGVVAIAAGAMFLRAHRVAGKIQPDGYVGSGACRGCHEPFYQLWSTSRHGLAMQPYSVELARRAQFPDSPEIHIDGSTYKAELTARGGWIVERGAAGERRYPIEYTLGGKDIYYFLTALARGRLQVLPLAFDVGTKTWMDATMSMTMHESVARGRPLPWRDRALTFNTSCYGCHVSQIETDYDPADDSYRTTWREPGINCETCHGPAGKHVRLYEAARKKGGTPSELGLISFRQLTPAQRSDACAACHARREAITTGFRTGEKFFDHFSLAGFENPDFYPDGRDLGENYTYTSWMMSACAKSGKLDCIHCHTSSGRYRFAAGDPNAACLPCHAERVRNAAAHTHHQANSPGNRCISCHMPMTEYARMRRSDHSMRPPTPATTLLYGSPNACNGCHTDQDARWADGQVRRWHADDYQAPALARAALIDAARQRDWAKLPAILAYIEDPNHDSVFAASLVRLLGQCPDPRKLAAVGPALRDSSPMVRGSAVDLLAEHLDAGSIRALAACAKDESRLVRVRAAEALSRVPFDALDASTKAAVQPAMQEYIASLHIRQDDYAQRLNLGNFYQDRGKLKEAAAEYERAAVLRPQFAPPLVNAAVVYSQLGEMRKAEAALRQAIAAEPAQPAAHFNLGLLLAETGGRAEAEAELRKTLELDGANAAAAYNLAVLIGNGNPAEALALCRRAAGLDPENPKYQDAVAYYRARQIQAARGR
jgi:tetratricopeptide (TPR) repeat protein